MYKFLPKRVPCLVKTCTHIFFFFWICFLWMEGENNTMEKKSLFLFLQKRGFTKKKRKDKRKKERKKERKKGRNYLFSSFYFILCSLFSERNSALPLPRGREYLSECESGGVCGCVGVWVCEWVCECVSGCVSVSGCEWVCEFVVLVCVMGVVSSRRSVFVSGCEFVNVCVCPGVCVCSCVLAWAVFTSECVRIICESAAVVGTTQTPFSPFFKSVSQPFTTQNQNFTTSPQFHHISITTS